MNAGSTINHHSNFATTMAKKRKHVKKAKKRKAHKRRR